jgi:hypothetical protein
MNNRQIQNDNEYLEIYLMCKEFNCLPHEGGLLDQPAHLMSAFSIIREIVNQYEQEGRHG